MTKPKAARSNAKGARVYPIPNPDTGEIVELPSVTSLTRLLAAPGLDVWKQKLIAETLSKRPDLVALAGVDSWGAIKQALDAGSTAANIGTAVHGYTETADAGVLDLSIVPPAASAHLGHYVEAARTFGWKVMVSEATVYNHEHGYAGTLDWVLDIPGLGVVIADMKTGKGVYPEVALQLAFYAHAEGIWNGRDRLALPDVRKDVGAVIHLTADACELVVIDLRGAWEACRALAAVARWQSRRGVVVGPYTAGMVNGDALIVRLEESAQLAAEMQAAMPVEPTTDEYVGPVDPIGELESFAVEERKAVARVTEAFPGAVVGPATVPAKAKDRLTKRVRDLDPDLLAEVAAHVRAEGVPRISDDSFNASHLDVYQYALEVAEHTQAARRVTA